MGAAAEIKPNRRAWLAEHDTIYKTLIRISTAVADLELAASERRMKKIAGQIAKLLAKLEGHFRREEEVIFARVAQLLPDTVNAIDRLSIEHGEFSQELQAAHDQLLEGGGGDLPQLSRALDQLVNALYAHEAAEEKLAKRALDWQVPERA